MATVKEPDLNAMLETHPCYTEKAHTQFARMHLPVAPKCNIQCNYCNRRFDCMNESRPGVTSEILTPEQAVEKIRYVKERIPYLTVIGIAGPGDPLANEETFRTLDLVRKEFPEMSLCLSTNGLMLPRNVDRLKSLGVRFITVTINAVDPEIGSKMYEFVKYEGKVLRGIEAAEKLVENQLLGVKMASKAGMLVKVNVVMVPEVNAEHIPAVAKKVKQLGAYIVNVIPLIPVPGTNFASMRAPTPKERKALQDLCESDIKQMRHCRFCRADAVGLLGEDRSSEFAHVTCSLARPPKEGFAGMQAEGKTKYRIAVASSDGKNVDLHFGHAESFLTFTVAGKRITPGKSITYQADMDIPMFGMAHANKLEKAADALSGFDAVLATKFGDRAVEELQTRGVAAVKETGEIRSALRRAVDSIFKERAATFSE
ncbi:MAG: nitrogenase cofactor biosynthesis protein NifB [Methanomassiliicoccales archaeon]|nr:nitrogenase cofactor biosynthesis protein NifB [Methanomassiliicoccales archaeon]